MRSRLSRSYTGKRLVWKVGFSHNTEILIFNINLRRCFLSPQFKTTTSVKALATYFFFFQRKQKKQPNQYWPGNALSQHLWLKVFAERTLSLHTGIIYAPKKNILNRTVVADSLPVLVWVLFVCVLVVKNWKNWVHVKEEATRSVKKTLF